MLHTASEPATLMQFPVILGGFSKLRLGGSTWLTGVMEGRQKPFSEVNLTTSRDPVQRRCLKNLRSTGSCKLPAVKATKHRTSTSFPLRQARAPIQHWVDNVRMSLERAQLDLELCVLRCVLNSFYPGNEQLKELKPRTENQCLHCFASSGSRG